MPLWQLSVTLSVLNLIYKLGAVWSACALSDSFTKREDLIKEMEVQVEEGLLPRHATDTEAAASTSSGEPLDSSSLAAQAGK